MAKLTVDVETLGKMVQQKDPITFTIGFIQGTNRWIALTQNKEGDVSLYSIQEMNESTPWDTLKPIQIPVEVIKAALELGNFETLMFEKCLPELKGFESAFKDSFLKMANEFNEKLVGFNSFDILYILNEKNQETKSRLLRKFGYDRFVKEADMTILHEDKKEKLYQLGDVILLQFFDPSKEEIGFIRVPPNMKTVKEAAAWTFNMNEKDYVTNLKVET